MKATTVCRALVLGISLGASTALWARPDPGQKMDTSLLGRSDLAYSFSEFEVDSADHRRHYRIWVGLPRAAAPKAGYPVLYMLDGNAAIAAFDPARLQALNQGAAPVLVGLGYATPLRIDREGRTFDYTPQRTKGPQLDPLTQLESGGAEVFLTLVRDVIKPRVNGLAHLNLRQQGLWGHSYAGLLTTYTLLRHPQDFQYYAAASPSLWWDPSAVARNQRGLAQRLEGTSVRLLTLRGSEEGASPRRAATGSPKAAQTLTEALARRYGVHARYQEFPGLSHGPMLEASLKYTLDWFSQQTAAK